MANLMGKRYTCAVCEATVLVTKAGDGELSCHGQAMEIAHGKAAAVVGLSDRPRLDARIVTPGGPP